MRRIVVDPAAVNDLVLHQAVLAIRRGGVVAMPTDTLYGLAVDPCRAEAVERLFAVKGRAASQALLLIAADVDQVRTWIGDLPPLAARLASQFWPGPLTLLLAPPAALPPAVSAGTSRVGVRVPAHAVARALCGACGRPLTATSANLSGEPPSASPDDIARTLGDRIDVLVDAGMAPGGPPSTIVDATGAVPLLVRAGAIAWDEIRSCACC
ncbi:MAG: L-threonylcarbamoyladenylate synthase [Acidobacteriota bacterium]